MTDWSDGLQYNYHSAADRSGPLNQSQGQPGPNCTWRGILGAVSLLLFLTNLVILTQTHHS